MLSSITIFIVLQLFSAAEHLIARRTKILPMSRFNHSFLEETKALGTGAALYTVHISKKDLKVGCTLYSVHHKVGDKSKLKWGAVYDFQIYII